jgi:hypothetical protein
MKVGISQVSPSGTVLPHEVLKHKKTQVIKIIFRGPPRPSYFTYAKIMIFFGNF